jgi:hypothetical protein
VREAPSNTLPRLRRHSREAIHAAGEHIETVAVATEPVARDHAPRHSARPEPSLISSEVKASQSLRARPPTPKPRPRHSSFRFRAATSLSGPTRLIATRCARRFAFRVRRGGGVPPPLLLQPRRGVTVAHHHELREPQTAEAFTSKRVPVLPNHSLNRTRYGRQRKPGPRHMVHHLVPGLRRLPPQAG